MRVPLLEVINLRTYYETRRGLVKAVDGVNLTLDKGEILGVAGESGCGKTTLALSIMKLLPPEGKIVSGKILLGGEDIVTKSEEEMRRIRWEKVSMVFQHSMNALNPVLTIERQLLDAIRAHKNLSKEEAIRKAKRLFEMVGLDPSRLRSYPHEFSGGMRQRVMMAMALAADPQLVIADEPTTGLDVITQSQILELLKSLERRLGLSVMIITHDLAVIAEACDRVAIMYAGKIVETADVMTLFKAPMHPYTALLIKAFPSIKRSKEERLPDIKGKPPTLLNPPRGCRFHPRCPYAREECRHSEPPLVELGKNHLVACHLAGELELEGRP